MSGRQRQYGQPAVSEDPYKIWRPQERQVESDSERPRYKPTTTSQSQRNQEEGRYYSSSRGYKSDSPSTASASQYRSGTSSSKTLHHPSRPSVSSNHVSRSQHPVASSSTTPTAAAPRHHSRSQPPRSQPEAHGSRVYSHNRNTSTPTPQSSHERVPSADEFSKPSRLNSYPKSGHAAPGRQSTVIPEIWIPPTQDPSSLPRARRDRDRDRDKEVARDRNKEKPRESSERRREREIERRDDAYRDRDKAKERDKYPEKRVEEEREKEVVSHREPRNTSKPTSARDTHDIRPREPASTSTYGHRRHRSEDLPPSSTTSRRPHGDSKQPSASSTLPTAAATQTATSGGHVNIPPPTPRVMPVYLPAKQPTSHKPSHERSSSTPAILVSKEYSTSDSEQTSRREHQSRSANDPRPTTTTAVRDHGTSRSQKDQSDRPFEIAPSKSKHEAKLGLQFVRSKLWGSAPPSTPLPEMGENNSQVPQGPPASSLSVSPTENRRLASAKQQFVSIRAGQGPSDPQTSDALFKKPAKSIRETRPDNSDQPSASVLPPTTRVQEQVKRYESFKSTEAPPSTSTRAHIGGFDQNGRSMPTKSYPPQSISAAATNPDRAQPNETSARTQMTASASSRPQTNSIEPNDRSYSTSQLYTHQPTTSSHDHMQYRDVSVRPERAALASSVEPNNRSELAPKLNTHQSASSNNNALPLQSNEAPIKPDMVVPPTFRARTTNIETNHRSAPIPKPSLSQPMDAMPVNRPREARTVRFDLPPPSPSPPPVTTSIAVVGTTTVIPHTSRSETLSSTEVRPPMLVPLVASSSSGSRQMSTSPSQSNQTLFPPQTKDRIIIDQQSLALSAVPPIASSQPQVMAGDAPSSLSTALQVSPAKNTLLQTESSERILTVPAPVLAAVSSQSQPVATAMQTTPSQSHTKTGDVPSARQHAAPVEDNFRQGSTQADVVVHHSQTPVSVQPTSSTADQHRTISETSRPSAITLPVQISSAGANSSSTAPAVVISRIESSQSHIVNATDARPTRKDQITHPQSTVGDDLDLPALPAKHPKNYIGSTQPEPATGSQHQSSAPDDARPVPEPSHRHFASVLANGRDTAIPVPDMHPSTTFVTRAQPQGNIIPVLSGASHTRQNSNEVNTGRPKVELYASTPQISAEESHREALRRDTLSLVAANVPPSKTLFPDPKLSTTVPIAAPQITTSRDPFTSQNLSECRSPQLPDAILLNPVSFSRSGTSTSASSQQPSIGTESSRSRRALLNEDLPSANIASHKKQDLSASQDAAEDTVLLPRQLHEEAPPSSSSTGLEPSRPSHDPALDNASRTTPFNSWHQSTKQPESHFLCLPEVDPPQSMTVSALKAEPHGVQSQQSVPLKSEPHGSRTGDVPSGFNQYGILPKTALPIANHVYHNSNLDELRSPKPSNPATSTPFKGDVGSKENVGEHSTVRRREQDGKPDSPAVFEGQRIETYRSTSRAPSGVTPFTQDTPSRFPVVEDVVQQPNITNRPERQKFSYAPSSTPVLDPHHGPFSPVQQAIRAAPTPQIPSRSLPHDMHTNDLRSRGQTDVPSMMLSQHIPSRPQPYGTTPITTAVTPSVPSSQPISSVPLSIAHSHNTNASNPSRPDEQIMAPRTASSSAYPSTSSYPTALNRSESQPTAATNAQKSGLQTSYFTNTSQHHSRHVPGQNPPSFPTPDIPQTNVISRASDAARKAPVNRVQAPHPSASNPTTFAQESTSTHNHNVSLTNATLQPAPTPMPHPPAQKTSFSSIKGAHAPPPPTHVSSPYQPRSDSKQTPVSTRVPVSTAVPPRVPRQLSRKTSDESILMTPSSLAPSMLPKTNNSRAPSIPITRQESRESKESYKKKNGFLSNIFRSKTPTQKSYEIWHPPASDKQRNQSQSSLQSTSKAPMLPSGSSSTNRTASAPQRKAAAPIAVDLPLQAQGRKEPEQKVFSAFKFLHTKRNRTVSHASVEALDGQTQTATNTVVGSPAQSSRSQTPFAAPPVRDPQVAAREWRSNEDAEMRLRAKIRRPGVVFDMEEDPPASMAPKKKLSRRRQ